jgi:hypothetical protein
MSSPIGNAVNAILFYDEQRKKAGVRAWHFNVFPPSPFFPSSYELHDIHLTDALLSSVDSFRFTSIDDALKWSDVAPFLFSVIILIFRCIGKLNRRSESSETATGSA